MERLNKLIDLFTQDRPAFGVFATALSTRAAVSLGSSPLDFVVFDLEHSPFDLSRLETCLLAMTNRRRILEKGSLQPDVVPLVRIPANGREMTQSAIKQALDLGAFGVVAPHVNNAAEALNAVRAARFPQMRGAPDFEPAGQRGVGYGYPAHTWGLSGEEYARRADLWALDPAGELLLVCMIESRDALNNLDQVLDTPGIGAAFIGASDLAFSLGLPDGHPEVETYVAQILAACARRNIPCGLFAGAGDVEERIRQGFRLLALGSDTGLSAGVSAALEAGRRASA
jgi:4-hydroxy-2-oxoheptanedioate aldolase